MRILTSKEKSYIRKLAQKEKAIFQIGSKEIHEENIAALKEGFNTREMMKVKVNREDIYDKKITKEIAGQLVEQLNCEIAGIIGTTIIIFKEHKNPSKRELLKNVI